jgi:hypothetical protein
MVDPTTVERIRAIFLHAAKHVTIEKAAAMLGRTEAEICRPSRKATSRRFRPAAAA